MPFPIQKQFRLWCRLAVMFFLAIGGLIYFNFANGSQGIVNHGFIFLMALLLGSISFWEEETNMGLIDVLIISTQVSLGSFLIAGFDSEVNGEFNTQAGFICASIGGLMPLQSYVIAKIRKLRKERESFLAVAWFVKRG